MNDPAVPVPAASVALVRDGAGGIETWLMRRAARRPGSCSPVPAPVSREIDTATGSAGRRTPAEVPSAGERGETLLLPPTITMLRDLADAGSAAEAVRRAAARDLTPVRPRLRRGADGGQELVAAGTVFRIPTG